VLTDGHTQIRPLVSPECFAHLHPRATLHGVILVRKYTIRYTSYGPPRNKLQFILNAVDWLGAAHPEFGRLKALQSEQLLHILRQLHATRAREDRRCLGTTTDTEDAADEMAPAMKRTDDMSQGASQPHTQYAYGTQLPPPTRAQDNPRFLGMRPLEPVLAGNTQREEIRPKKIKELLSLLKPAAEPISSKPAKVAKKPRESAEQSTTQLHTQLPVHVNRQPTQTQPPSNLTTRPPPQPPRSTKRARETDSISPRVEKGLRKDGEFAATAQESKGDALQKHLSECSWMKDFEFTRDAFVVPYKQLRLLQDEKSWHKPTTGRPFPTGNVPVEILTTLQRMADENAAMEAGPDSDDEMDEDPSPESIIESIQPSAESVLPPTQEDQCPTSEVSWPASPSPEPPQILSRLRQDLPPDSSFEAVEPAANHSPEKTTAPSRSQSPIRIDSSNEKEQNELPSSPPIAEEPAIVDEDLEMEEYVPQALGEDSIGGAMKSQPQAAMSVSPPPRPVVQVKETPYVRDKNGQHKAQATSSPGRQLSNGSSKQTSSASIVYGTYKDKVSSDLQKNTSRPTVGGLVATDVQEDGDSLLEEQQRSPTHDSNRRFSGANPQCVSALDTGVSEALLVSSQQEHLQIEQPDALDATMQDVKAHSNSEATSVCAQPPVEIPASLAAISPAHQERQLQAPRVQETAVVSKSPSLTPGATKRKHETSPSKKSGRHSKRREIKIMDFDGDTQPTAELLSYREESLRRFREARKAGTSPENRPESAGKAGSPLDMDAMQVDVPDVPDNSAPPATMSPRHESLYEEPKSKQAALASTLPLHTAKETSPNAQPPLNPKLKSSVDIQPDEPSQLVTRNLTDTPLSVFESFKAAYPKYTGDIKHFQSQCIQMIKLDRDDKMVPKWQWDDFIIRNRTDYKEYALECVDQGEDPEPYHRFYKDKIRDTIYRKGIIEGRSTLLEALEQLNVQPPTTGSQESPKRSPERSSKDEKRTRKSLPSSFAHLEAIPKSHSTVTSNKQSRQSMPAPLHTRQTPVKDRHATKVRTPASEPQGHAAQKGRSTSKSTPLSRLQLDGSRSSKPDATTGTGDPYRDFYFASMRTTSLTGSTKVSSKDKPSKASKR
jgi:hypothetical protein